LITGATDGIGLLLARSYASRGLNVLATGRRSLKNHRAFFGVDHISYLQADQEEPARTATLIAQTLKTMGWEHLDIAILNAAIGWAGRPEDEPARSIESQIAINLKAPICIAREVAPRLFANNGKLTLIGSTAAKGQGSFATYAATKAGLNGFARSLREEWRGRAQVQIVHPGPVRTDMHAKAGMKLGIARMFFMPPRRAAMAIERAVRSDTENKTLTRTYALFSKRAGEGQL